MVKSSTSSIWGDSSSAAIDGLALPCKDIANDLSCQGSIGFALQQALNELVDEDDNNNNDQRKQQSTTGNDDDVDTARNSDEDSNLNRTVYSSSATKPTAIMTQGSADWILKSFGHAMMSSQQHQHELLENQHKKNAPKQKQNDSLLLAPPAVLQGRLDHSNRIGTKWRMELQNVQIANRQPLSKTRRKRKSRLRKAYDDSSSNIFWDMTTSSAKNDIASNTVIHNNDVDDAGVTETDTTTNQKNTDTKKRSISNYNNTIKIQRLELLAYNDLG